MQTHYKFKIMQELCCIITYMLHLTSFYPITTMLQLDVYFTSGNVDLVHH